MPKANIVITVLLVLINSFQLKAQQQILITAPQGYSERFIKAFENTDFSIVVVPCIETTVPDVSPEVDNVLQHLQAYDYIAFSSRKAVDAFVLGLKRINIPTETLKTLKFCAIGKDADYVFEKLHTKVAILPDEPSPMGIAEKLSQQPQIKSKTIAVFVPQVLKIKEPNVVPDFIKKLKSIGMRVTRVNAYLTEPADISKAVRLIKTRNIKCVAFTSSAEIEVLLKGLGGKKYLNNVDIACFGVYTAAFAKRKGLKVSIVSKDFSSFDGFVKAIREFYREPDGKK